jgi:hypothetical protein
MLYAPIIEQVGDEDMFRTNAPWWLPGTLMVLFGLTIVVFPELLALMVASALIMIGLTWLLLAWNARKLRRNTMQQTFYYDRWQPW